MGIVRRSTRKIEVDGQKYLWKLTNKEDVALRRCKGESYTKVRLTVGIDDAARGQVLQCDLKVREETNDDWLVCKAPITPDDIANLIKKALCAGWVPQAKKPPLFKFTDPFALKNYDVVK